MAKRLDHLIWPVADLEKTVRFYTVTLFRKNGHPLSYAAQALVA